VKTRGSVVQKRDNAVLDRLPTHAALERPPTGHQTVGSGDRVRVLAIEARQQLIPWPTHSFGTHHLFQQVREQLARDLYRRRPPPVTLAENEHKVRTRRYTLTSSNLSEADRHRRLLDAGFLTDPPTQINRLEFGTMTGAQGTQPGKRPLVQRIAFSAQVVERAADKNPEDAV